MKFSYTHHMPYTGIEKVGQDWPVANKQFRPDEGMRIFRAGIDTKVFAEECGFDWIGNNEHHMSPYGLMPNPNLIGVCVAERTRKAMILQSGNIVPIVNPIRVAEEYAMLDMISGGRLVAGFMRGIPHEYVAYTWSPRDSTGHRPMRVSTACRRLRTSPASSWIRRPGYFRRRPGSARVVFCPGGASSSTSSRDGLGVHSSGGRASPSQSTWSSPQNISRLWPSGSRNSTDT